MTEIEIVERNSHSESMKKFYIANPIRKKEISDRTKERWLNPEFKKKKIVGVCPTTKVLCLIYV